MYDAPYILSGKNLSFLPFFIPGRESISICIEVAEQFPAYSRRLQDIGFSFSDTIFLDNVSKEAVPWDCSREKNLTYFEENGAILSENFEVNLFIWDTYNKKIFHFKKNATEVPAHNTSSMNTELTVRLAQPVNVEDVRVLVKWSLYFTNITIGRSPNLCTFKPNSYKWKWNYRLRAPTINIKCKEAISINDSNLHLHFTPRTPIWDFPMDRIELKLDNGTLQWVENEEIFMEEENLSPVSINDFVMNGTRFPTAKNAINLRIDVRINPQVKGIRMMFLNTLDMKLGEERLSINEVLKAEKRKGLRIMYAVAPPVPSPSTRRSEINMTISTSHWFIEKISVTQDPSGAEKDIWIACGVIIPLIAVIVVVIWKCRRTTRVLGPSGTQTTCNRRVDTGDAGTKDAFATKAPQREVSHEMVELETNGIDKSTNNEGILENWASANAKAHSEFSLYASISRKTVPLYHESSYEEDNIIYGEF
ncbi:uncharacterized protein LOC124169263 [Ischnura elegans]|uniref:uncharacterized protein LOC124169263 n=1 Tax=Ischnura elegans TaxID=197161 RepID=UPI001ED89DB5|nr:uncharacterized protein LOC124169263 [Ischnura elegans]